MSVIQPAAGTAVAARIEQEDDDEEDNDGDGEEEEEEGGQDEDEDDDIVNVDNTVKIVAFVRRMASNVSVLGLDAVGALAAVPLLMVYALPCWGFSLLPPLAA